MARQEGMGGLDNTFFFHLFFVFGERKKKKKKKLLQWKNRFFLAIFPRGHKQYRGRVEMEQQIVHVTFTRFSGNWRHMTEGLRADKRLRI